jgi:hypothetical protein
MPRWIAWTSLYRIECKDNAPMLDAQKKSASHALKRPFYGLTQILVRERWR